MAALCRYTFDRNGHRYRIRRPPSVSTESNDSVHVLLARRESMGRQRLHRNYRKQSITLRVSFMTTPNEIVFLLDVDNTLLDNDHVQADLKKYLEREFGTRSSDRYWAIFDQLRAELGYADYLGALQRYRA